MKLFDVVVFLVGIAAWICFAAQAGVRGVKYGKRRYRDEDD